jgi:hypothetical protein
MPITCAYRERILLPGLGCELERKNDRTVFDNEGYVEKYGLGHDFTVRFESSAFIHGNRQGS